MSVTNVMFRQQLFHTGVLTSSTLLLFFTLIEGLRHLLSSTSSLPSKNLSPQPEHMPFIVCVLHVSHVATGIFVLLKILCQNIDLYV
jgi:hypothetical protein